MQVRDLSKDASKNSPNTLRKGSLTNTETNQISLKTRIRVLYLDDDKLDSELSKIIISQFDPQIEVVCVSNIEEAIEKIKENKVDLLLSDYDMPDMNGITFAKMIREYSNIPIIIYTGRGSEEVAENAFAAGIDDYIRKENEPAHYQVLVKRIRHAIDRMRADKALRESEECYRSLIDHSPYAISITVEDKIVYANLSRAMSAGVDDPQKLIGTSSQIHVSQEDWKEIIKRRLMRERGLKPRSPFILHLVSKDGSCREFEDYSNEIIYEGKKAIQHLLVDVTERKIYTGRLEALHRIELELLRAETIDEVAEQTLNAIKFTLGFDRCGIGIVQGKVLQFRHILGMDYLFDLPLKGRGITVRAVRTGETQIVSDVRVDDDYVTVIGDFKVISEVSVPVKVNGQVVAVLNVESSRPDAYSDDDVKLLEILSDTVTSAIQRIRSIETVKASDNALRLSEDRFRYMLDSAPDGVAVIVLEKIVYVNQHSADIMGYPIKEILQKSVLDFLKEDYRKLVADRIQRRARGEEVPSQYGVELIRRDGSSLPVELSLSQIKFDEKNASLIFIRDISSEKEKNQLEKKMDSLH